MKVTKIGHCCFVIEEKGVKLLTDPGAFTSGQNEVIGVDGLLVTHEHIDHYHVDSIKTILKNNPNITILTNSAVGTLLKKERIPFVRVGDGDRAEIKGLAIEGFGKDHAFIYNDYSRVENTGFYIGGKLYFPGDALHNPHKLVDILALPVYGPWMRIADAIDYAKEMKPRAVFNMHDAPVKVGMNFGARVAENFLTEVGIQFVSLQEGDSHEF